MLEPMRYGIVIVDHGSRRAQSNELLELVASEFAKRFTERYEIVEPAHMEIAEPSIATAFGRCVERGARRVVVCPFFLGPGKHWTGDIPRLTAEAAAKYPDTRYHVTMPLGIDELILELLFQRASFGAGHAYLCDSCKGTIRSGEPETAAMALAGGNGHAAHAHEPATSANAGVAMQVCSSCPYAKAIAEGAMFTPVGAAVG